MLIVTLPSNSIQILKISVAGTIDAYRDTKHTAPVKRSIIYKDDTSDDVGKTAAGLEASPSCFEPERLRGNGARVM